MKAKIDVERFVASLIKYTNETNSAIRLDELISSLEDQGLTCKDGKIEEINEPLWMEAARQARREAYEAEKGINEYIKHHNEIMDKVMNMVANESNNVNNPSHYQSLVEGLDIDCITAMRAAKGDEKVKAWLECNAFKYNWRLQHKGGNEDAEKAIWNLNKFLELGGCNESK